MSEKFLSSQQREIARLRCTTSQAFNFMMVAWLLSANHISEVHSPPAENGICLCQNGSVQPPSANWDGPADTQRRGDKILGAKALSSTARTHTFALICAEPPLRTPQTALGKRSQCELLLCSTTLSLLRSRFHFPLFYLSRWLNSPNPTYNVLSFVFITIQSSVACLILILVIGRVTL